jgi:hypothetical protein
MLKAPPPLPEPPWQMILEDIRSQSRAILAAVEASRAAFSRELQEFRQETNGNFEIVFGVLREHSSDYRAIKTDLAEIKTTLRRVNGKVDHLSALELRVAAIERSGG